MNTARAVPQLPHLGFGVHLSDDLSRLGEDLARVLQLFRPLLDRIVVVDVLREQRRGTQAGQADDGQPDWAGPPTRSAGPLRWRRRCRGWCLCTGSGAFAAGSAGGASPPTIATDRGDACMRLGRCPARSRCAPAGAGGAASTERKGTVPSDCSGRLRCPSCLSQLSPRAGSPPAAGPARGYRSRNWCRPGAGRRSPPRW
jgi:hypothetical protein